MVLRRAVNKWFQYSIEIFIETGVLPEPGALSSFNILLKSSTLVREAGAIFDGDVGFQYSIEIFQGR